MKTRFTTFHIKQCDHQCDGKPFHGLYENKTGDCIGGFAWFEEQQEWAVSICKNASWLASELRDILTCLDEFNKEASDGKPN
jgi:hypothetical protein